MNLTRPWIVAGTTITLAGIGLVIAAEDVQLNDRRQAPVGQMSAGDGVAPTSPAAHTSPESADSPDESPFDSADSAADSPDDAGFRAAAPAPAPRYLEDSGNSPAPAPRYSAASVDSPGSAESADSP